MLTPGIYYKHKNSIRQLIKSLPGTTVYPRDNNLIPYTTQPVTYVNSLSSLPLGATVIVKLNGTVIGSPKVFNTSGTYAVDFVPPLGTFEIESVYPDSTTQKQIFRSVRLYTFLATLGEQYKDFKTRSILASSGLYVHFLNDGILKSQANDISFRAWGDMAGFVRPFDWPFDRYADVLGGNTETGIPGYVPAFSKGSTTGAVKDVVESVTGYRPTDDDFRLLQSTIKWQLSRDGAKYDWLGGVHDTGAVGPHYFLRSDRTPANVLAAPVAVLESDIRKAFTILLKVIHDGFFVEEGEVVTRSTISNKDKLQYSWLNPWAYNPTIDYQTGYKTYEHWVTGPTDKVFTLPDIPAVGQEIVYLNGLEISDADYTLIGNVLTLGPSIAVDVDDYIQVEYLLTGPARWHDEFIYAGGPQTFILPQLPIPNTLNVFVNGKRLDVNLGEYTFTSPDRIDIVAALGVNDRIDVVYADISIEPRYEESQVYSSATPPVFTAPDSIVQGSVRVYVNGIKAHTSTYDINLNGVTVDINYTGPGGLGVVDGDRITVTCAYEARAGYNVNIVQGTTTYSQGYHFHVNYRTGEVLWDNTKPNPAPGTGYQVYYTYFPKDILEAMLMTVKPVTMRVFQEFETSDGRVFKPYLWGGVKNPTGNVIL